MQTTMMGAANKSSNDDDINKGAVLQNKTPKELNVDQFLELVGEYGKFQILLNIVLSLMVIPIVYTLYIIYFTALPPDWQCVKNSTVCTLNSTQKEQNDIRCKISRSEWEYVQSEDYSMIVQYDLGCNGSWLVDLSTSVIFIGGLFGSVILTWVSDNFGRKKVSFTCFFFLLITHLLSAFMPNIWLFITLRFLTGFFSGGNGSFVMITEITGHKWRSFAGNLLWVFYTIALCLLPLKAYYIDSWKMLVVACSLPYILILLLYTFVPESVRWLRLKGKTDEAMSIFQRMAKWNGKQIDSTAVQLSKANTSKEMSSPLDIFRPKSVARNTVILLFGYYTNALVYYGISLAADDIGVDSVYLSFILVSLVELPSSMLAVYCSNRFGRKKASSIPLGIAGLLTLAISFTPTTTKTTKIIRILLGMLGKLFVTVSYDSVTTLIVEVYPTNIRSEAYGIISIASYIGGASAPWIAKGLGRLMTPLPFYVMGSLGLFTGFLCHFLPETKGVEMKESFEKNNTNTILKSKHNIELQ